MNRGIMHVVLKIHPNSVGDEKTTKLLEHLSEHSKCKKWLHEPTEAPCKGLLTLLDFNP